MAMSDDLSGAVISTGTQVAAKGIDVTADLIKRLLDALFQFSRHRQEMKLAKARGSGNGSGNNVKSSDMTDIKSGVVSTKELFANARKNGESVIHKEGFSKSDMKYIAAKAKKLGIPIAVERPQKDCYTIHIRECDKKTLDSIERTLADEKMKTRPQELGNFKCKRWEIDGIQRELSKHDLPAQWIKNGNEKDEYFCIFEKTDEKAILIARSEFARKVKEVETDFKVEKPTAENENFYTLTDEKSGKTITFNTVPSKNELSEKLQKEFGYDENKAEIACAKFGQDYLEGVQQENFFSDSPQNEFSDIKNHITLDGEDIHVKPYDCPRVTPKADGVSQIVFRSEDGEFVAVNPNKMTRKEMGEIIAATLDIEDKKTIDALVDKAVRVNDFYNHQDEKNFSVERHFETTGNAQNLENIGASQTFSASDFNMDDPKLVAGLERTDENGKIFTREMPITEISSDVQRLDKNTIEVASTAHVLEFSKDERFPSKTTANITLSLDDRKGSIETLTELYKSQGVPEKIADKMATNVFDKAAEQYSKIVYVSDVKSDVNRLDKDKFSVSVNANTLSYKDGNEITGTMSKTATLSFSDKKSSIKSLTEMYRDCGVPEHTAKQMAKETFSKAQAQSAEKVLQIDQVKVQTSPKNSAQTATNGNTAQKVATLTIVVTYGNQTEEIDIPDQQKAVAEISQKFKVSEESATILLNKAEEKSATQSTLKIMKWKISTLAKLQAERNTRKISPKMQAILWTIILLKLILRN